MAQFIAFLFAIAAGFVFAGIVRAIWHLIANEEPDMIALESLDRLSPLRGVALVFAAPLTLLSAAARAEWEVAILFTVLALCWSFMQGVVILSRILGAG